MNKYKILILSIIASITVLSINSCNFLDIDRYLEGTFKQDSIFHSKQNAEGYLFATVNDFPDPGKIWGNSWNPGELASDEMCVRWKTHEFWGAKFTVGEITSENVPNASLWSSMYKIIRKCNTMLEMVDQVPNMTTPEKNIYKSYAHFARGYAYYHLLMNWGPILCVGDKNQESSLPASAYNKERMTFDESIDYICNEFEQAGAYMPTKATLGVANNSRPPKAAAYALIARLRLIQASPMFNGGSECKKTFGEWIRESDKKYYVNQEYDPKRWAVAAACAKRVIDMDAYNLHTIPQDKDISVDGLISDKAPQDKFPDGVGGIDPYHSFSDMFTGISPIQTNPEFIWAVASGNVSSYTRHSFPVPRGGWGGMSVPQRVVDAFYMKDGSTLEQASIDDPEITDLTKTGGPIDNASDIQIREGTPKMYLNRSARFYASIGYPGRVWTMDSDSDGNRRNNRFWYSKDDDIAGLAGAGNNINDYCISGYVPVKYISSYDSYYYVKDGNSGAFVFGPKPFAIIRYAEVLLIYAEALNYVEGEVEVELPGLPGGEPLKYTISRNIDEMKKGINPIRYRVGLPGPTEEQFASVEEFEKVIRNERQVELFNEGFRYFDTRRWGIYPEIDAEGTSWRGLDVQKDKSNTSDNSGFWNIVQINEQNIRDRIAKSHMVFLPLPQIELRKVPKMSQNPGWDR